MILTRIQNKTLLRRFKMERIKIKDLLKETTYPEKLSGYEEEYNKGFKDGYKLAMERAMKILKEGME